MDDVQVGALVEEMTSRGLTVATAESLTGGGLVARLVDVPGASHVVRGGAAPAAWASAACAMAGPVFPIGKKSSGSTLRHAALLRQSIMGTPSRA